MEAKDKDILLVNGVRHLYIPHLNNVSKCSSEGTRNWLANSGNFIPSNGGRKDCFEITLYDISEFLSCWAKDIVRLASASFETLEGIAESSQNKKFLAWQMVQYYYAAFYSAHSTLKVCGFGLIQIDDRIIRNIMNRASSLGTSLTNSIDRGMYCVKLDFSSSKVIFYKVSRYDDSHRGLWWRYADFLDVLSGISISTDQLDSSCVRKREADEAYPMSIYSQLPLVDAERIVKRIESIKETLNAHGDNNWLAFIRNNVNYNHSFGIWFPYKAFKSEYEGLVSMQNLYKQNPLGKDLSYVHELDLCEFVKCCQTINSINREILFDLASRHPLNKSFLNNGPLELIKLQHS